MWKAQRRDDCGPQGELSWGEEKLKGVSQG